MRAANRSTPGFRPLFDTAWAEAAAGPVAVISHGGPVHVMLEQLGVADDHLWHYRRQFDHQNPLPPAGRLGNHLSRRQQALGRRGWPLRQSLHTLSARCPLLPYPATGGRLCLIFLPSSPPPVARNDSLLCVGLDPNPAQIPARYRQPDGDVAGCHRGLESSHHCPDSRSGLCLQAQHRFLRGAGGGRHGGPAPDDCRVPSRHSRHPGCQTGRYRQHGRGIRHSLFRGPGGRCGDAQPLPGARQHRSFCPVCGQGAVCALPHLQSRRGRVPRAGDRRLAQPGPGAQSAAVCACGADGRDVVAQRGPGGGATFPEAIANVRAAAPDAWFLVPGIGTQGGDLAATLRAGLRADGLGLIINASRNIAAGRRPSPGGPGAP